MELNCSKHTTQTFWCVNDWVAEWASFGLVDGADDVAEEAGGEGEAGVAEDDVACSEVFTEESIVA